MKDGMKRILPIVGILVLLSATAMASGGSEHHADGGVLLKDFLWRCLNFGITLAILIYFVTKPIRNGLALRREKLAQALDEAARAKREAEAKFAEYDSKLAKASEEIDSIYQDIRREGEIEREKILENAQQMAAKIQQEAEKSAALEISKARVTLREEAARLAIDLAEELLKKNFTADDQSRLVKEYVQKVGELH